jgi:hypothetical protein
MTLEINELETIPVFGKNGATQVFELNAASDDLSVAAEELIAAPGAGLRLVLKRLQIALGDTMTLTIFAGEDTGGTELPLLGPLGGAAGMYPVDFGARHLALPENVNLSVQTSGAGQVCLIVEAYVQMV